MGHVAADQPAQAFAPGHQGAALGGSQGFFHGKHFAFEHGPRQQGLQQQAHHHRAHGGWQCHGAPLQGQSRYKNNSCSRKPHKGPKPKSPEIGAGIGLPGDGLQMLARPAQVVAHPHHRVQAHGRLAQPTVDGQRHQQG